jgi:pre-mRNA cleavage complex 2 protein Pcf11
MYSLIVANLIIIQDWIYNVSSTKGKGTFRLSNPKAEAAAEQAKKEAELRAQFVVVPAGDEAAPISCPICKESLKPEFLEDDEEWVWKNAVRKDDKVCLLFSVQ